MDGKLEEQKQQQIEQVEEVANDVLLYDTTGHVRKIPIPSADPNDPLNWSNVRQLLALLAIAIYGISGFGVVQSTPLVFPEIIAEYKKQTRGAFNAARINDFASYPSLCMGIGNFLFVPLSMALGRRCVFIINNLLMFAAIIWAAKSTNFSSHLGARCLQGLSAGISDCLLPIIILDMSFLHKRGLRLVVYWAVTAVGASLLLVAVPFVVHAADSNWRVNYWFWLPFSGVSLIVSIFLLPETLFQRPAAALNGKFVGTDSYGTVRLFDSAEDAAQHGFDVSDSEASGPVSDKPSWSRLLAPSRIPDRKDTVTFFKVYYDLARCLLIPGVLWVLVLNSVLFGGMVILSMTYAQLLEGPHWHFSPETVGTVQVGSALGAILSLFITGGTIERLTGLLTRRNQGRREPEHVLINFIFPCLLVFAALTIYGVVGGNPTKYSWVGVHAAFALFYCGFCAISALTGMWVSELVPNWSGPALVLACGGRNAISFGISHSFPRWLANMGFRDTHILLGGILLAAAACGVPLYFARNIISRSRFVRALRKGP